MKKKGVGEGRRELGSDRWRLKCSCHYRYNCLEGQAPEVESMGPATAPAPPTAALSGVWMELSLPGQTQHMAHSGLHRGVGPERALHAQFFHTKQSEEALLWPSEGGSKGRKEARVLH